MSPQTLLAISNGLLVVSSLGLGIYTLAINPKHRVNQLWFLASTQIALWGFGLHFLITSQDFETAKFFNVFLHVFSTFIPIFIYHFFTEFLFLKKVYNKIILVIGYPLALFFAITPFFSSYITGVSQKNGFAFWTDVGPLYKYYFIYFVIIALLSIIEIVKAFIVSREVRRKQLFYLLIATLIAYPAGTTSFFPQLFGIYPFGQYFTFLYPIVITYGIFIKKY